MRTLTLDIDYSEQLDFELIGIISTKSPFRVAWALNVMMGWSLEKTSDVLITIDNEKKPFTHYLFEHQDDQTRFTLVENKSDGGIILPEWSQFDYFIKVEDSPWDLSDDFLIKLRNTEFISAAFPLPVDKIKSKHNLIFCDYAQTDKRRNEEDKNRSYNRPGLLL